MGSVLAVGLMSGTSLDGVDAALIETDGEGHVRPIAFRSDPYSEAARTTLREAAALALTYDRPRQSPAIVEAEGLVTRRHILAVRQLLAETKVAASDVAVIGFDNVPESALANPPLTTIDQPLQDIGAAALRMLVELLEGREPESTHVRLPTAMVERASCRRI